MPISYRAATSCSISNSALHQQLTIHAHRGHEKHHCHQMHTCVAISQLLSTKQTQAQMIGHQWPIWQPVAGQHSVQACSRAKSRRQRKRQGWRRPAWLGVSYGGAAQQQHPLQRHRKAVMTINCSHGCAHGTELVIDEHQLYPLLHSVPARSHSVMCNFSVCDARVQICTSQQCR